MRWGGKASATPSEAPWTCPARAAYLHPLHSRPLADPAPFPPSIKKKARTNIINSAAFFSRGAKKSSAGSLKDAAKVTKKKIQTKEDHIFTLRAALFTEQGQDKDVTKAFAPFLSFKVNPVALGHALSLNDADGSGGRGRVPQSLLAVRCALCA